MGRLQLDIGKGSAIGVNIDHAVSALDVMADLGVDSAGVVAWKVGGSHSGASKLRDIRYKAGDGDVASLVRLGDAEALGVIRHDAAHLLAQALKILYPSAKFAIGPSTSDGFYYDVDLDCALGVNDLPAIEEQMRLIVESNISIDREVWSREEALEYFSAADEVYKVELVGSVPDGEEITVYRQGDFVDLCEGPHFLNVSLVRHFKLLDVAGAYWRGNSSNKMLVRIYGTAFNSEADLQKYLLSLAEAEKRDHRKIGRELDLFHTQNEAVGQVFWHANGYTLYLIIESYIRGILRENGYCEVKTPILVDSVLWKQSGHLEKFAESMIMCELDERLVAIKPMNCPCHAQIFKQGVKSYRDLPIRMSEFGMCHRNESSGSMRGLMRVRGFTQDDAHIFCTEQQVMDEVLAFCKMVFKVYSHFGFDDVRVKFSDRPHLRAGDDAVWDRAEAALMSALRALNKDFELNSGEGAFYGPKLEFVLSDALGRDWQCGTVQLDFVLPERLDIHYIDAENNKQRPVMIHRAILGTFERFIGILIEHYAGKFPMWLAPVQIYIANISESSEKYARDVGAFYVAHGFRVSTDCSGNKIGHKIKRSIALKIPFICVVGDAETESRKVSLRHLGSNTSVQLGLEESLGFLNESS